MTLVDSFGTIVKYCKTWGVLEGYFLFENVYE